MRRLCAPQEPLLGQAVQAWGSRPGRRGCDFHSWCSRDGGAAGSSAATLRLFPVLVQTSRGRGRPGHSSCGRWNLWFCLGLRKHSVLAHQGPGHRLTRALQPLLCVGGGFVGNWEIAPPPRPMNHSTGWVTLTCSPPPGLEACGWRVRGQLGSRGSAGRKIQRGVLSWVGRGAGRRARGRGRRGREATVRHLPTSLLHLAPATRRSAKPAAPPSQGPGPQLCHGSHLVWITCPLW